MKNFKGTLIALLVLAALGAYIKFFEKGPAKDPDAPVQGEKIFTLAADDVSNIQIENAADSKVPRIELAKNPDATWKMVAPDPFLSDESTLRNLLNNLSDARYETQIKDAKNLADYGLEKPVHRLKLSTAAGKTFALAVGSKNVNGSQTYIQVQGMPGVGLVQSYVVDALDKKPTDFRNKQVFKADIGGVKRVALSEGTKRLVLERQTDNSWKATAPITAAVSEDLVRQFLSSINGYQAVDFPEDHPKSFAAYGLAPPQASLTLDPVGNGPSRSLEVGKRRGKEKNVFVKDRDLPYLMTVNDSLLTELQKKVTDFKSKDVMKFSDQQVTTLTLRKGPRTVTYTKDANGVWQSAQRASAQAEAPGLLAQMASTAIVDFAGPKEDSGVRNPVVVAELTLKDGTRRVFRYGNRKADKIYLASDRDNDVYLVAGYVASQIESYLNPAPQALPTASKK